MRTQVNPANLVTTGSVAAAFAALVLAADGHFVAALVAIGVAAVLDSIDGPIARRTSGSGVFGSQLDLLADHAAFAMAPAFLLHQATLHTVPVAGPAACLLFVLAGAWRLARFGATEDDRHRFAGLPLPPAGLIAAAAAALGVAPGLALPLLLAIALTMVSSIPFPTFAAIGDLLRASRPVGGVVARDRRFDRGRAAQRAGRNHDEGQRYPENHDEERIGAPALARE